MISDEEFVRYSRQICLPEIGESGQEGLKNASVLIVGCGGLGNIAALYLSAAGVGRLVIADGDILELSNLHRQIAYSQEDIGESKSSALKKRIQGLNSNCRVTAIEGALTGERLSLEVMMHDLILDCSDNFSTRLEINGYCQIHRKTLISGSAIGWEGQLMIFPNQPHCACYECLYPLVDQIDFNKNCSSLGVIGPVVSTIGSLQSLEALKILLDEKSKDTSWLTKFDGLNMSWNKVKIKKNIQCRACN